MQLSGSIGTSQAAVGRDRFPALLVDRGLIGRDDLAAAEALADREHLELADAVVGLDLVSGGDSYAALAAAAGVPVVHDQIVPSELAVRLVPERLARRHFVVPSPSTIAC